MNALSVESGYIMRHFYSISSLLSALATKGFTFDGAAAYVGKKEKADGVKNYIFGVQLPPTAGAGVFAFVGTKEEMHKLVSAKFEKQSPACNARMGKKAGKNDMHVRVTGVRPKDVAYFYVNEKPTFTAEEFEDGREFVKKHGKRTQNDNGNKGYAFEYLVKIELGYEWDGQTKGVDIPETATEIKFQNGQWKI